MNSFRKPARSIFAALLTCAAISVSTTRADDIDIFLGTSGGAGDAPNIIFYIDNSPNWSRAAQHWPDNGGNQGQAELGAISSVLNSITSTQPANVGLAMMTAYAGPAGSGNTQGTGGGYIRFGVRDMTVSGNKTALQNILAGISNNTTDPAEKVAGMSNKDEDAGFYEIYKYLSGLPTFTGPYGSQYANENVKVDIAGNPNTYTAASQGLGSGFAVTSSGNSFLYTSPITSAKPCVRTYIIYIANNANNTGSGGQPYYQKAVADADPALPGTLLLDTWTDEWTKFLYTNGVVVPAGNNNGSVVTYILDAYYAQQNVGYSNSLINAAKAGGGKYFAVGTQAAITDALLLILDEIQAVNSTFSSAALPVNTTNRAQDKNQVFIPQFRPDADANPLWMGNLKEYQLVNFSGITDLGDSSYPSRLATSPLTGFFSSCAVSSWTTDSGTYWQNVAEQPRPKGSCPLSAYSAHAWSDLPDGPTVEKGGVAEVIRKGNNPPTTNGAPTWGTGVGGIFAPNRTVYTLNASGSMVAFTAVSTLLPPQLVNFVLGQDVNDENNNGSTNDMRVSLHGDEIHSRPVPVDYGSAGVTVYYGSNDGMLHAVDAGTNASSSLSVTNDPSTSHGAERWAFIAPEFYTPAPVASPTATGFYRLMYSGQWYKAVSPSPAPLISFPGQPSGITPTPAPKDYYFDGSIGLYQSADIPNKIWIYPSMRRGGRMIYAFDVSTASSPSLKWRFGCPHKSDDTGCMDNYAGGPPSHVTSIGQTWSTPVVVASINGYTDSSGHSKPVLLVGGGYDTCEDANTASPSCSSPKGAGVYAIDAGDGHVIHFFSTTRSVAADVTPIAVANAGVIDHAYAADTGGNIWRIDFTSSTSTWAITNVASTNVGTNSGAGRKFLFAPALLTATGGQQVYVAIGSGDREHPLQSEYPYSQVCDSNHTNCNRFYVYLDSLSSSSPTNLDDTTGGVMSDFTTGTTCSTPGVLPGSTMKGWFMDLNQNGGQGEQTVTSAVIAAGMVFFSTNRPVPSTSTQASCSTVLGIAYGYAVNLFNASGGIGVPGASCGGTRSSAFIGGGLPPSPVLATVPVADPSGNNVQVETVLIGGVQLSGGPSSPEGAQQLLPAIKPVRKTVYWKSSGEN